MRFRFRKMKITIPKGEQKRMIEFFLQTSIPRKKSKSKKAKKENPPEKAGEEVKESRPQFTAEFLPRSKAERGSRLELNKKSSETT